MEDTATATANVDEFRRDSTAMATGSGAQAFGIQAFTTASVNNSGTIKAVATGSGALSFGIAAATVNVVNSGLVSGGTGIAAGATSQIQPRGGTHSTIVNSGTIIGTNGVAIDFTGQSLAAILVPVPRSPPRTTRSPCFPARASSARYCSARTTR